MERDRPAALVGATAESRRPATHDLCRDGRRGRMLRWLNQGVHALSFRPGSTPQTMSLLHGIVWGEEAKPSGLRQSRRGSPCVRLRARPEWHLASDSRQVCLAGCSTPILPLAHCVTTLPPGLGSEALNRARALTRA